MLEAFSTYAWTLEEDNIPYVNAIRSMWQVDLLPVPEEKFLALSDKLAEVWGTDRQAL